MRRVSQSCRDPVSMSDARSSGGCRMLKSCPASPMGILRDKTLVRERDRQLEGQQKRCGQIGDLVARGSGSTQCVHTSMGSRALNRCVCVCVCLCVYVCIFAPLMTPGMHVSVCVILPLSQPCVTVVSPISLCVYFYYHHYT